jgi:hypothetical protein
MQPNKIASAALIALLTPSSVHAQGTSRDPLPIEDIRRVVRTHQSAIRRCYERARREEPRTPRHIDMSFSVLPNGRVTRVTFPPHVSNFPLGLCIGRLMQTWQFPQPYGGYTASVEYPFDF